MTHAASDDVLEAAVNAALIGGMRAMTAMPHNFTFGDFKADISAINVPTLILHGTEESRPRSMRPPGKLTR